MDVPSCIQAPAERRPRYPAALGKFAQGQCLIADRDYSAVAPIDRLLRRRGPATISGFIVSVVVNPVEANPVARRRRPHVFKKGLERSPSIANCDPTSAIAGEEAMFGAVAAISHRRPHAIFLCALGAMGRASDCQGGGFLNSKTSAAQGVSRPDFVWRGFKTGAAITSEKPKRPIISGPYAPHRDEPPVTISGDVHSSHRAISCRFAPPSGTPIRIAQMQNKPTDHSREAA